MDGDCEMDIQEAEEEQKLSVIDHFKVYAVDLDIRHDLYEKLVKKSRDLTQEAKKIIFMLHRVENKQKGKSILKNAKKRLSDLYKLVTVEIGSLLVSEDVFLYLRAFRPGIQEFIEAISFYYYLSFGTLVSMTDIHQGSFLKDENESDDVETGLKMTSLLIPSDYILGIADLTGELMRRCISSKSLDEPFLLRIMLNDIYKVFKHAKLSRGRVFRRKCQTLKASLHKVEMACFSIHIRTAEIKKLISVGASSHLSLEELQSTILESVFTSVQEKDDD